MPAGRQPTIPSPPRSRGSTGQPLDIPVPPRVEGIEPAIQRGIAHAGEAAEVPELRRGGHIADDAGPQPGREHRRSPALHDVTAYGQGLVAAPQSGRLGPDTGRGGKPEKCHDGRSQDGGEHGPENAGFPTREERLASRGKRLMVQRQRTRVAGVSGASEGAEGNRDEEPQQGAHEDLGHRVTVDFLHGLAAQGKMGRKIADELVEHLRLRAGGPTDPQGVPERQNGVEKRHEEEGGCRAFHEARRGGERRHDRGVAAGHAARGPEHVQQNLPRGLRPIAKEHDAALQYLRDEPAGERGKKDRIRKNTSEEIDGTLGKHRTSFPWHLPICQGREGTRNLDTPLPPNYYPRYMASEKSEATREWVYAGKSAVSMYGSFFYWLFREPFPVRQLGQQIVRVMLEAFGVLMITAFVEGGLFAWLGGWDGSKFSVLGWAGAAAVYLLLTESTTLIGAMIFAARIGTAFTVEIGSMQMSGQLDALRLMAVEPAQYIVIPRVLASILCLPILKALSDGVAILACSVLMHWWFDVSLPIFYQHVFDIIRHPIITTSYVRSAIMAFFIAINGCGLGFNFQGGAVELGKTTTKSIVINLIVTITVDCLYGVLDSVAGWSVL